MLSHEEWHTLIMTWIIIGIVLISGLVLRKTIRVENPGFFQLSFEKIIEGLENFCSTVLNTERLQRLFPFLVSLFLFILLSNFIGLFSLSYYQIEEAGKNMVLKDMWESPTNTINTTAALAILTFIVFTYNGLKELKGHYFKRFLGPVIFLAPFMVFIEIISEFAKPFSLSVRLFANVKAEEILYNTFLGLVPFLFPLIAKFLMILTDFLQAFVFIILTMVYVNLASDSEH